MCPLKSYLNLITPKSKVEKKKQTNYMKLFMRHSYNKKETIPSTLHVKKRNNKITGVEHRLTQHSHTTYTGGLLPQPAGQPPKRPC